jgi:hypothetical protein
VLNLDSQVMFNLDSHTIIYRTSCNTRKIDESYNVIICFKSFVCFPYILLSFYNRTGMENRKSSVLLVVYDFIV